MKEQWIVDAEHAAKDLAWNFYDQILYEADDNCIDREWFFEKVIYYMRKEIKDNE